MNTKTKKIIAQEFLIILGLSVLTLIVWSICSALVGCQQSQIFNLQNQRSDFTRELKNVENKLSKTPIPILHLSKQETLPQLPSGYALIIDDFEALPSNADIKNDMDNFNQARNNLILIHDKLAEFEPDIEKDFYTFIEKLNKYKLVKIHNGITGTTKDYINISDIPLSFSVFLTSIGIDTNSHEVIKNRSYEKYKIEIEKLESKIDKIKKGISKIEESFFYKIEPFEVSIWALIILAIILYPLRFILKMTQWSIRILRNKEKNK